MVKIDAKVFWLSLALAMTSEATPKITAETPVPWLEAVISNDSQFSAILQQQVNANSLQALQSLLPYSVAIVNKGNVPIVGLAIRFKVISGEKTVARDYFYYGFRSADPPVVAAGQTRLFAPDSTANDVLHGRPLQPGASAGNAADLQLFSSADAIQISIDLAIGRNQRTAGADEGKHIAQLLNHAQALHDMAAEFVARSGAGASDAELKNWLSSFGTSGTPSSDRYQITQKRLATEWLGAVAAGKRSDLQSALFKAATLPDMTKEFLTSLKAGL
jgi:hypothetical protein